MHSKTGACDLQKKDKRRPLVNIDVFDSSIIFLNVTVRLMVLEMFTSTITKAF